MLSTIRGLRRVRGFRSVVVSRPIFHPATTCRLLYISLRAFLLNKASQPSLIITLLDPSVACLVLPINAGPRLANGRTGIVVQARVLLRTPLRPRLTIHGMGINGTRGGMNLLQAGMRMRGIGGRGPGDLGPCWIGKGIGGMFGQSTRIVTSRPTHEIVRSASYYSVLFCSTC